MSVNEISSNIWPFFQKLIKDAAAMQPSAVEFRNVLTGEFLNDQTTCAVKGIAVILIDCNDPDAVSSMNQTVRQVCKMGGNTSWVWRITGAEEEYIQTRPVFSERLLKVKAKPRMDTIQ